MYNELEIEMKISTDNYCDIEFETPTDLSKENLKIIRQITPKKGTCVLFDGSIYHTQSNPITSQLRVNMNVNVILKD